MTLRTSNEVSLSPFPRKRLLGLPAPLAVLLIGLAVCLALYPFDGPINAWLNGRRPTGDVRREWEALQQFGQGTSIAVISLVIFLLDPPPYQRRRRLLDLALALIAVGLTVTALKILIGRVRPNALEPASDIFLFLWGKHPVRSGGVTSVVHSWDPSTPSPLWSMPSSHTAFAVVTALFLAILFPRLRWLVAALAGVVATGRLVFDAHWPTDVVMGATVAAAVAWPIITGGWGCRLAAKCRKPKGQTAG